MQSDGTFNYTYDEEGNLTKRITLVSGNPTGATTEFEYDHRNRLVKVTDKTSPTGTITKVTEYGYDGFDRAVKKTVDPDGAGNEEPVTEFSIHDGSRAVLKLDDEGDVTERLLWQDQADLLLADETAADGLFWMLGDHQGTIRDVLDADGDVVNHIAFDSFGNIQSQTENAPTTTIVYAGLVWDNDIGQYRSFTRMYLATIGQWTGEDWIGFNGDPSNLRRYVLNAVTIFVDPSGLRYPRDPYPGEPIGRYPGDPPGWGRDPITGLPLPPPPQDGYPIQWPERPNPCGEMGCIVPPPDGRGAINPKLGGFIIAEDGEWKQLNLFLEAFNQCFSWAGAGKGNSVPGKPPWEPPKPPPSIPPGEIRPAP